MLAFMRLFESVADLRTRFVAHVIRACCLAKPNLPHVALLDLLDVVSPGRSNLTVSVFTTNYDNLLEKTADKYRVWRLSPQYLAPRQRRSKKRLAVIPLHGSIRISQCPGCGRVLETQAASLGPRLCVYCGSDIPNIILPMEEGDINKEALEALEAEVRAATLMLFVGYGFNDPHLRDSLVKSSTRNLKIINASRATVPDKLREIAGSTLELNDDLSLSLSYLAARLNLPRFVELQAVRQEDIEGVMALERLLHGRRERWQLRRSWVERFHRVRAT